MASEYQLPFTGAQVEALLNTINALADSDDETLDQVSELVAYIKANRSLIEQITTGKVSVSDIIDNLTTNVANKPLSAAQGVVLKGLIDALQTAVNAAAKATDLTSHTGKTTVHITAAERTKWNQAVTDVGTLSDEIDDLKGGEIPTYWNEHLNGKIATIKALHDANGKDCFSFIVIADPHYPQNLGKISPVLARKIMDECNIRYAIVLGDMQNRGSWATKELAENDWVGIREMFAPIADRILYQQGNHDGAWGNALNGVTYPYRFTEQEIYNRVFAPTYAHHNVITDLSETGYYIDDTARKVRYILLNTSCNPYEENEDGSAKYTGYRFTQSQYDMVIEALKNCPDGYSIIVCGHVPINNVYAEAFGGDDTTGDHVIMRNLLKAYKEKKSYSGSWDGTAGGGTTGGYTNLFDTSGDGFTKESDTKYTTNWLPYNPADNDGNGTIYHFKGFVNNSGYTNPYKYEFATDTTITGTRSYCTSANRKACVAADYDSSVKLVQHSVSDYTRVRFEFREAIPDNLIITANEDIIEATGGEGGYDAVAVDADFTNAKGDFVAYFSGHAHADYVYGAKDYWGVDIITTRCDSANENNSTLLAERKEGTITEQSFDVFTVTPNKIYATKIGAGADREISR